MVYIVHASVEFCISPVSHFLCKKKCTHLNFCIHLYRAAVNVTVPSLTLHRNMVGHTLEMQTTDQQRELWLSKAHNWEFISTYAQTELGHGMCFG